MDEFNDQQPLTKKQRREMRRQAKRDERSRQSQHGRYKKLIITIISVVILAAGAYWAVSSAGSNGPIDNSPDTDPVKGSDTAKVTIEEFSDFQCPACQAAVAPLVQLVGTYPNDIKLVYNDFPLSSHKNSRPAAEAAQCAFAQAKFWEYHDVLFDNQDAWSSLGSSEFRDKLIGYARELNLDEGKFTACSDGRETKADVDRDVSQANSRRVSSTPTFFVNGEKVVGALSFDQWKAKVEPLLQATSDSNTNAQ